MKNIFTVADICRILKISENTVTRSIERGELKAIKEKRWRIDFRDAANYIRLRRRKS